jgi:hypothetical protein
MVAIFVSNVALSYLTRFNNFASAFHRKLSVYVKQYNLYIVCQYFILPRKSVQMHPSFTSGINNHKKPQQNTRKQKEQLHDKSSMRRE